VDDPRDTRPVVPPGRGQILHFPRTGERVPAGADSNGAATLSGSDLFALLWQALAEMLGTAAAATLLRRAAQRATPAFPDLSGVDITRAALEYQYKLPEAWQQASHGPPRALFELVRELWPLLVELTGSVVVTRLLRISELRESGLVPPAERIP
jgi:hypothetical protein